MKTLLKNAMIFTEGKFVKSDLEITDNTISKISANIEAIGFDVVYDLNNMYLLPGLIDVHTHLREPGFIYKETIATGSYAGAKGWIHKYMCNAKFKSNTRLYGKLTNRARCN